LSNRKHRSLVSLFIFILYSVILVQLVICMVDSWSNQIRYIYLIASVLLTCFFIIYQATEFVSVKLSGIILLVPATRLVHLSLEKFFYTARIIMLDKPLIFMVIAAVTIVLISDNDRWSKKVQKGGRYVFALVLSFFFLLVSIQPLSWLEVSVPTIIRTRVKEEKITELDNKLGNRLKEPLSTEDIASFYSSLQGEELDRWFIECISLTRYIKSSIGFGNDNLKPEKILYGLKEKVNLQVQQRTATALEVIDGIKTINTAAMMNRWFYPLFTENEREYLLDTNRRGSAATLLSKLQEKDRTVGLSLKREKILYEDRVARVDFFDDNALETLQRLKSEYRKKATAIIENSSDDDFLDTNLINNQVIEIHEELEDYIFRNEVAIFLEDEISTVRNMIYSNTDDNFATHHPDPKVNKNPYLTLLAGVLSLIVPAAGILLFIGLPSINQWRLLYVIPIGALCWIWVFISWLPFMVPSLVLVTIVLVLVIIEQFWKSSFPAWLKKVMVSIMIFGWGGVQSMLQSNLQKKKYVISACIYLGTTLPVTVLMVLYSDTVVQMLNSAANDTWLQTFHRIIGDPVNLVPLFAVCSMILSLVLLPFYSEKKVK
jgi:hypothetical protein